MNKKLYDCGNFIMTLPSGFRIEKDGWHLAEGLKPASEYQQRELEELGWGKDKMLSMSGADVIIEAIKNG